MKYAIDFWLLMIAAIVGGTVARCVRIDTVDTLGAIVQSLREIVGILV